MRDSIRTTSGCLIFVATIFGFASTVIILALDLGKSLAITTGGLSVIVIAIAACILWKYHRQPDLAPDFLAKLSKAAYAEAGGLCFIVLPLVSESILKIHIHYQNRFDHPCEGSLEFTPNRMFKKGLPDFGSQFNCGIGDYGVVEMPWPVAKKFAGKVIHFTIRADIRYPRGQGKALRFRLGQSIRSGRSTIRLRIPKEFEESNLTLPPVTRVLWTGGEPGTLGFPVELDKNPQ